MRDIVIKLILDMAIDHEVPIETFGYWSVDKLTAEELQFYSDMELIEMLIHVVTYDPETYS